MRRAAAGVLGGMALGGLVLTGCQSGGSASPPSSAPAQVTTTSPSPGLSVPGTHRPATSYRISSPVSTVVVISHVGNITVTGGVLIEPSSWPPRAVRASAGSGRARTR